MKNAILLIAGLLIFISTSGQNQLPLVQEDNEWNVLIVHDQNSNFDTTCFTRTFKIIGDTNINNQTYKKIYESDEDLPVNWDYHGSLREEDEKVWVIRKNKNQESLIYDFDLSVGDTITWLWDPMIIDSIIYKPINNEDRKHIYFSYQDSTLREVWIEGIGSNRGLLSSGTGFAVGGRSWLLCMKKAGNLIYMNPDYNNCFIETGISESESSLFQIFPNPAINKIKINIPRN